MGVLFTLVVIGLVIYFFIRASRGGRAVVAAQRTAEVGRPGSAGAESYAELLEGLEGVASPAAMRTVIRDALAGRDPLGSIATATMAANAAAVAAAVAAAAARANGAAKPVADAVAALAKKAKKQTKAHRDSSARTRFGGGIVDPLQPLQPLRSFAPLDPMTPLRVRRPLAIHAPLEPIDVPAAYAARSDSWR